MKLLWTFALTASLSAWGQNSPTINDLPSREFGHLKLTSPVTSSVPNLIEGRELNGPFAVAFSSSGAIYIADTNNHRVLAWRNSASLTAGNSADLVIGQRDFFSASAQGPGRDLSSGLSLPIGLAVDGSGNVYVVDAGNNRIVRYPNPFSQTSTPLSIDLVIGQKTQGSGNLANEGQTTPSAKTLSFFVGGFPRAGIALDVQGNLWVADAGNNRVLRFPVGQLTAGTIEPAADLPLGQPNLTTNSFICASNCQINGAVLFQPQGLAFDSTGALYVADNYARVLYYQNPQSGTIATKFLGVLPTAQQPTFPNEYSLANSATNTALSVFTKGDVVFVADAQANRVVRYNSLANFNPTGTAQSPRIDSVVGQADLVSGKANRGLPEPDATTLSLPTGGAFDSAGNLWIVDFGNNRVLSYPANGALSYPSANVVVGQTGFPFNAPNLIEGREVWIAKLLNGQVVPGGGIVVDKSSNPPRLYIADTFNNRVLGFKDARAVGTDARSLLTQKADLVIGQPAGDLFRSVVNYGPSFPTGDPELPTRTGLNQPVGLAVDDSGNLWVADSGNGRVLRFPSPFGVATGTTQSADLVLGQSDFNQKDLSASQQSLHTPWGLTFFPDGHLAVSDTFHNRVLVFQKPFTNGKGAFSVVGQQTFAATGASTSAAGLNNPRGIAIDPNGRLYVTDAANNRVQIYTNTSNIAQTGPTASFSFPFSAPQAIAVSQQSFEMWVASGTAIYHLPEIVTYQNTGTIFQQVGASTPLAIALDASDNPIVAEATNRITFYFAKLQVKNAFTFTSTRGLTPGMWVQANPVGKAANVPDDVHQTPPYPKSGSGLQMLVNGTPAGIYALVKSGGLSYINFVIPWNAATSGSAEFQLFNPATGEIVAAGTYQMAVADPAFKTTNGLGVGQILAANIDDGGLNSPSNPVSRGKVLQLALTGQGLVNNPPADGTAPTSLIPTPSDLQVIINNQFVPAANILFSGLDPTYPGSWIINVVVPLTVPPSGAVPIIVQMHDIASNFGYNPNDFTTDIQLLQSNGRITTIAVK